MKILLSSLIALLAFSCASPQKPYKFPMAGDRSHALPSLRAALAEEGHQTEMVDEQAGIVYTSWVDTGFLYGDVQGIDATIVRRYVVIVTQAPSGQMELTLRADTKRCAQDGYEFAGQMVTGACEGMNELVRPHQDELNALGAKLERRFVANQ